MKFGSAVNFFLYKHIFFKKTFTQELSSSSSVIFNLYGIVAITNLMLFFFIRHAVSSLSVRRITNYIRLRTFVTNLAS